MACTTYTCRKCDTYFTKGGYCPECGSDDILAEFDEEFDMEPKDNNNDEEDSGDDYI